MKREEKEWVRIGHGQIGPNNVGQAAMVLMICGLEMNSRQKHEMTLVLVIFFISLLRCNTLYSVQGGKQSRGISHSGYPWMGQRMN